MKNYLMFILILLAACNPDSQPKVVIYNAPAHEKPSADFEMFVNNRPVFVYQARVSKFPINQIWPGYQRPLNQTEIASFAYFDMSGETSIRIVSDKTIRTLDIRPKEYGIKPAIEGNSIEFKISKPQQLIVEINGYHKALHIFANPVEDYKPDKKDPKVHYFGPGTHEAGTINVKSGETVYIAGGAVVHGVISSENTRNIRLAGRGILDASKIERGKAPDMIDLKNVVNAHISGIILRDPHLYTVRPLNCDSTIIDNIKLIGLWRYNTDGIHPENCKNVTIRNCFVRAFDDAIVFSGEKRAYKAPYTIMENIKVDSCVVWNDWGRALEIGAGTVADTIKNFTFSNIYIPHFTAIAMDIQNSDRGVVENIRYKNISIEDPILDSARVGNIPLYKKAWGKIIVLGIFGSFYSQDSVRGQIKNIYFENIRYNRSYPEIKDNFKWEDVTTDPTVKLKKYDIFLRDNQYFGDIGYNCTNSNTVWLNGRDSAHMVSNVVIKDYFINGKKADLSTVGKNEFVTNLNVEGWAMDDKW
jgi:hypothetical protein